MQICRQRDESNFSLPPLIQFSIFSQEAAGTQISAGAVIRPVSSIHSLSYRSTVIARLSAEGFKGLQDPSFLPAVMGPPTVARCKKKEIKITS